MKKSIVRFGIFAILLLVLGSLAALADTPPSINSVPPPNGTQFLPYVYLVNATDADNDTLRYYDNSSLFDIDPATGLINFTPQAAQNITVSINVSDNATNTSQTYELIILKGNRPPSLRLLAGLNGTVGEPFVYTINASDPDNDALLFWDNSSLFNITDAGVINFTPQQNGTSVVEIIVGDNHSSLPYNVSGTFLFSFNVTEQGSGDLEEDMIGVTITSHSNGSVVSGRELTLAARSDRLATCWYRVDEESQVAMSYVSGAPDSWKVGTTTRDLELSERLEQGFNRETIADITSQSFIDDFEIGSLLEERVVTTSKGNFEYDQRLFIEDDSTGYVVYAENDDDTSSDFLYFENGKQIARYELEFHTALESDVDDSSGSASSAGTFLTDFEDVQLVILGKSYTIVTARRLTSAGGGIVLVLMSGTTSDTLLEGNTKTYNVSGDSYEVTLSYVDSDEAQFQINGENTRRMNVGDTDKLSSGLSIGIRNILFQDYAGGIHAATFYLGADKMELRDNDLRDSASSHELETNDETIDDADVTIQGTDNNLTVRLDKIEVNMTADDDYYVPAGATLQQNPELHERDLIFTRNWDFHYKGLSDEVTEEISLKPDTPDQYYLRFKDGSGNTAKLPILHATGGSQIAFGDEDGSLIVQENKSISRGDYFVVTDTTDENGKRKSYLLKYIGSDHINVDNPVAEFWVIGSDQELGRPISPSGNLIDGFGAEVAQIKIGGGTFRVYNASSIEERGFAVRIDLDGDGVLEANTISMNTLGGAEIWIINESSNTLSFNLSTPHPDDVEDLTATPLRFNISAENGQGRINLPADNNHNFIMPEDKQHNWYAYTSYGAFVHYNDTPSTPQSVTIDYPQSQRLPQVFITSLGTDNSYEAAVSGLQAGTRRLTVTCEQGNVSGSSFVDLEVIAPPDVTGHWPASAEVNVSLLSNITINFTIALDKDSFGGIELKNSDGDKIYGKTRYTAGTKQVTLDPWLPLAENTTYLVFVEDVESKFDDKMDSDYIWQFTTGLKDSDGDGIPDIHDDDADNDGINDTGDRIRGTLRDLNSNFRDINISLGGQANLSGNISGKKKVVLRQGGRALLEFDFNFSRGSLDFTNLSVINASNSSLGATIIAGVDTQGATKTAYVERVDASMSGICVKDQEIQSIQEISDACDGQDEFQVECDGSTQGGYSCTYNATDGLYKVSGLQHSGIKQSEYTKSSGSQQSGSSSSSSSGGGGGGGGGGAFFVCTHEWQCSSWSSCDNGWQARECFYTKVPQHTSSEQCQQESESPPEVRQCEDPQDLEADTSAVNIPTGAGSEHVPGKDGQEDTENRITGAVLGLPHLWDIKNLFKNPKAVAEMFSGLLLVLLASGTLFWYRRKQLKDR